MKRNILITGAARGIGAATAKAFAAKGERLFIHYHTSKDEVNSLCENICQSGGEAIAICADLRDSAQIRRMFSIAEYHCGGIDVLVNNAAISEQKAFTAISEDDWDCMFDVNIKSAYLCTRAVLPYMLDKHQGWIINVSSIWGQVGASGEVHYSASKAALIGMTKALAKELAPSGILVNCVAPGVIDTSMNAHFTSQEREVMRNGIPMGRFGTPDEVASCITFLASQDASYMTGQTLSPQGGICDSLS